jgi:hypothetical protein
MSEFKFACPVCGQHVTCDSANSGSQMECPTCFRKLVVPQAPASESSKFILSAAQVGPQKPITEIPPLPEAAKPASRWWSLVWLGLAVLVLAGAAVAFVKLGGFKTSGSVPKLGQTNLAGASSQKTPPPARAVADPRWRLELADAAIPTTAVSGRILGREFTLGHASVQNGSLSLWQGAKWPPDMGVTILGPKRPPQDYAGKRFLIPTNYSDKTPRLILRTKDDQQHAVTQNVDGGYALKLEFDAIADGHLPGRIYLCLPDDAKTVVVGSFNAEIRKPNPPKPKPPPLAPPPQTPR